MAHTSDIGPPDPRVHPSGQGGHYPCSLMSLMKSYHWGGGSVMQWYPPTWGHVSKALKITRLEQIGQWCHMSSQCPLTTCCDGSELWCICSPHATHEGPGGGPHVPVCEPWKLSAFLQWYLYDGRCMVSNEHWDEHIYTVAHMNPSLFGR